MAINSSIYWWCHVKWWSVIDDVMLIDKVIDDQGRIQGGGAHPACPPPLKLEKIRFFGIKSWFFTQHTPKMFVPPSAHRNFFKCTPSPNLKSWIRPWWCHVNWWRVIDDVMLIDKEWLMMSCLLIKSDWWCHVNW